MYVGIQFKVVHFEKFTIQSIDSNAGHETWKPQWNIAVI